MMQPPGAGEAADSELVLVSSACWSCGAVLHKRVRAKLRNHRHFHWQCDSCSVTWSDPGTAA
jgi:ribosomal protein L37AE/L43A